MAAGRLYPGYQKPAPIQNDYLRYNRIIGGPRFRQEVSADDKATCNLVLLPKTDNAQHIVIDIVVVMVECCALGHGLQVVVCLCVESEVHTLETKLPSEHGSLELLQNLLCIEMRMLQKLWYHI